MKGSAVEPEQFQAARLRARLAPPIADASSGWFASCRAGRAERVTPDAERLLGREPRSPRRFAREHAAPWR